MTRPGFARKGYERATHEGDGHGVNMRTGTKKWVLTAVVAAVCIPLLYSIDHLVFTTRLAVSLQRLSSGAEEGSLDCVESKVSRRHGSQDLEALVYRPGKSPARSAVVIAAGISELGCYHPRLVALSRTLADKGLLVITPDIREFREFRITADPVDQIIFWYGESRRLPGSEEVRKVGLAGISFSATLALIAAARPEIRNDVGFLVGIGAYYDLARCARGWFAADPHATPKNYYPTRFYAKWIVMRAALDMVGSKSDRDFLTHVLDCLLLQKDIPTPPPGFSAEGARWYALATMNENQTDGELAARIEKHLAAGLYASLDPSSAVEQLRCPAFFIHGAHDDLIPPQESMDLHRNIPGSRLLISPFLTHTHPTDRRLSFLQKARAAADSAVFCFHLSRAIR